MRDFTPRELACLQGYPMNYEFSDTNKTSVKGQIGNAVPPLPWSVIMRSCHKSLSDYLAGRIDAAGRPITRNETTTALPLAFGTTPQAGPSSSHRGTRVASREPRSLPLEIMPSINVPIRCPDSHQAPLGPPTPTIISLGKRKLHEAFIDLTLEDNAERSPRSLPTSRLTSRTGPTPSAPNRQRFARQSQNDYVDLTGDSRDNGFIDLTKN
jgi:hypothetical protein